MRDCGYLRHRSHHGLIFTDDARQANPTRPGMGPLVATGGLIGPAGMLMQPWAMVIKHRSSLHEPPGEALAGEGALTHVP